MSWLVRCSLYCGREMEREGKINKNFRLGRKKSKNSVYNRTNRTKKTGLLVTRDGMKTEKRRKFPVATGGSRFEKKFPKRHPNEPSLMYRMSQKIAEIRFSHLSKSG